MVDKNQGPLFCFEQKTKQKNVNTKFLNTKRLTWILFNRNKNEIENSIIECQHWCVINSKGQWKIDKNENILDDEMTSDDEVAVTDVSNQKLKSKVGLDLEDDYNKAIARNIAVEIIKSKQQQKKVHLWMFFGLWPFIMYSSWAAILV